MRLPENAKPDVYKNVFQYKNLTTGEIQEFEETNYPWDDDNFEFVDRTTDYIFRPDKTIHKYKKPKDLKKILGARNSILTDYASEESLDLAKKEDLIKSLQFLNTKY